jgi:hypothetical protein
MFCDRCGYEDTSGLLEKRVDRGASKTCPSCRARPTSIVKTKFGDCLPHQGEFDDDDNPLDDQGNLLMPGLRTCNASDCLNPEHILTVSDLEAERHDISYRTGQRLAPGEFLKRLLKELF